MLRESFRRAFERRLPDLDDVLSRWQILQQGAAFFARDLKMRRRQHGHVSNHPIVNIASERDESFLVESDRLGRDAGIKRQLEFFRGRQRIDVMANVVVVWKEDRRADLKRGYIGNELFVSLIDDRSLFRRRGGRRGPSFR